MVCALRHTLHPANRHPPAHSLHAYMDPGVSACRSRRGHWLPAGALRPRLAPVARRSGLQRVQFLDPLRQFFRRYPGARTQFLGEK